MRQDVCLTAIWSRSSQLPSQRLFNFMEGFFGNNKAEIILIVWHKFESAQVVAITVMPGPAFSPTRQTQQISSKKKSAPLPDR